MEHPDLEQKVFLLFCITQLALARIYFFRYYVPSGDGKTVEAGPSNGGVHPDFSVPYPSATSKVKSSLLADN